MGRMSMIALYTTSRDHSAAHAASPDRVETIDGEYTGQATD